MITREKNGVIAFNCDFCPDAIDTEETNFHEALDVMKQENWKCIGSDDLGWQHACPSCAIDQRKPQCDFGVV